MQGSGDFRIDVGWAQLDPVAVAIIIVVTVLICVSTKESSRVNLVLVCTKLVGVLFVIIVGALPFSYELRYMMYMIYNLIVY